MCHHYNASQSFQILCFLVSFVPATHPYLNNHLRLCNELYQGPIETLVERTGVCVDNGERLVQQKGLY